MEHETRLEHDGVAAVQPSMSSELTVTESGRSFASAETAILARVWPR